MEAEIIVDIKNQMQEVLTENIKLVLNGTIEDYTNGFGFKEMGIKSLFELGIGNISISEIRELDEHGEYGVLYRIRGKIYELYGNIYTGAIGFGLNE
jgi:hypothetical protein